LYVLATMVAPVILDKAQDKMAERVTRRVEVIQDPARWAFAESPGIPSSRYLRPMYVANSAGVISEIERGFIFT
jgi:hypothetical protein